MYIIYNFHPHGYKVVHSTCIKSTYFNFYYKGDRMLLTKSVVKFNNHFLIKIPSETKRLNDLSENRWGYKKINYFK